MNAIRMTGQVLAMDGQNPYSAQAFGTARKQPATHPQSSLPDGAAEVVQSIAQSLSETQESVRELQKLSDMVMGHKLQFNVNDELGKVVIKVIDSSTNELIREIPSEEVQKLQVRMKQAIGVLFDETV